MNLKEILGKNIKRYRILKGYSQEQLSEKLGISQQTLSKIERGLNFLTSETLEKIPEILNIQTYELFIGENDNYTQSEILVDIEKHLKYVKNNSKKLHLIQKLIKEIVLL